MFRPITWKSCAKPSAKKQPRYSLSQFEAKAEYGFHPTGSCKDSEKSVTEKDILLIFDEVQTSFGRTGKLFACQHWNVTPDVMCLAKPLRGRVTARITVAKENIMASLKIGEHSTTYSGSPLVCAAGCAAIDVLYRRRN